MAAIATETARHARASSDVVSGALLASGAAALFVGTLFYARLTPELGLPALPAERAQALADALKLGPQALALAGGFAFLGDCLLLAACIVLASRRRRAGDLDAIGWALMAVSVALAMVFDSMTAALFWPLAQAANSALFVAIKSWFDFVASRCYRGLSRMSESPSERRRRSAGLARRLASCICPLSSASA